ncbi:MAG: TetR/AcrR family transcriptional regulator [Bdellovibrionales bacterium]|nr:TetR/AcrR family transcriptional regulator [Bdellovibrionales bacterium]
MGRNKGFNRDELLDKAVQVFWKQGFADTSLHDLEKATGVNKSGLYSEFRDKDDLFSQCLSRYAETNGVLEILEQRPLGRQNIENFLLLGQRSAEAKGCFIANTFRELSIVPQKAKNQMSRHIERVKEAALKNVVAAQASRSPSLVVDLILTFNTGIALQLNAGEIKGLKKQVTEFLDMVLS